MDDATICKVTGLTLEEVKPSVTDKKFGGLANSLDFANFAGVIRLAYEVL